jgi:hypothetical protein
LFHEKFTALYVRAVAVLAALPLNMAAVSWRVTTLSLVDKDVSEESLPPFSGWSNFASCNLCVIFLSVLYY